ncbi:peptide-methionine (S)-S-oxide reductase MsrA [Abyssibacter profundi]|uniref:Peptide methionine sulfoxide reductase MsrA n=1 Tax=Abyssibacter profundi TaxID=2182787 RepID=A0A363UNT5_9GAMM|nr:peptide-methionine (S)-S-oxide reductase MsrA [Abyssibacter profundi]PWN57065.1 peptide-methionine (S)-S-oxide reductase [Abyssibacter profundi]
MSLFARSSLTVSPKEVPDPVYDPTPDSHSALAVLAGGCFWCVEAVYRELAGVTEVVSGYSGGTAETADYKTVCTGQTEHAEVVQIAYDPTQTSYGQILKIFFAVAHDPTQLNRQGNDMGTQYRSAIFYADALQQEVAERYIQQLEQAGVFSRKIVTRLEPLEQFFEAEAYHQNYAALNPGQGYIQAAALPKVDKLRAYFGDRLRES